MRRRILLAIGGTLLVMLLIISLASSVRTGICFTVMKVIPREWYSSISFAVRYSGISPFQNVRADAFFSNSDMAFRILNDGFEGKSAIHIPKSKIIYRVGCVTSR